MTVSANATTSVTFTATNPVINSISENSYGNPNQLDTDVTGTKTSLSAVFSWSVTNATNFELYGPSGILHYSGGASTYTMPAKTTVYGSSGNYRLRAYNGAAYTDVLIYIENYPYEDSCSNNSSCSGS